MAFERRGFTAVLVHILLCSFFSFLSGEVESDISCLKSIKDSLEDPYDSLQTWVFNETSKSYICDHFAGVTCDFLYDDYQVLQIELDSRGLKGLFPRGIVNCSSLRILDLSYNDLSGYIPSHIFSLLPSLSNLDLSCNKFSGEIPTSISNLTSLHILRLNDNKFSGEIPHQLDKLTLLTEFSVANNLLWGPVPVFSSNVGVVKMGSYLNNKGLCGWPLEPCDPFHQSFREGLVAGYVFSAPSFIVLCVWYFVPWTQLKKARRKKPIPAKGPYYSYIRRKRKKGQQKGENRIDKLHLDLSQKRYQSLLHLRHLQEERCQKITEDEGQNRRMSFEELRDATDCFSAENIIGVGTIGIAYKARLPNGRLVALKRLYDSQLLERQFYAEIMILGRYKHKNIVPLLWFREVEVERKERILVYQYMPNERLSDFLSGRNGDMPLNWPVRVRIALGIARGLCWLHHNMHVVHLSMCSECILLDQNFEPKISNFGEAKFINQNIGNDLDNKSFYIDNRSNNEFGYEKMDVYNFGIVLLELLARKRFNPRTGSFGNNGSAVVSGRTSLSRSPSGFHEAIDKSLIGKGFDDEICTLLTIACYCIQSLLEERPTMLEVYTKMKNIWEGHEVGEDLEISKNSEVASATSGGDEIVEIESM